MLRIQQGGTEQLRVVEGTEQSSIPQDTLKFGKTGFRSYSGEQEVANTVEGRHRTEEQGTKGHCRAVSLTSLELKKLELKPPEALHLGLEEGLWATHRNRELDRPVDFARRTQGEEQERGNLLVREELDKFRVSTKYSTEVFPLPCKDLKNTSKKGK